MRLITLIFAASLLAPGTGLAQQSCLVSAQIWSWKPLDRKTLVVRDTIHRNFKVSLYAPCPGIDFNLGAAILSRGNTALDCVRPGDMVVHRGFCLGNRCPIKSVELYAPGMQQADEAAAAGH